MLTEECQSIVQADLDTVYDLASLSARKSSSALMLHGVFLSGAVLEASHESALLMMGRFRISPCRDTTDICSTVEF